MTKSSYIIPDNIIPAIQNIILSTEMKVIKLQKVCNLLQHSIPGYDWVGIYLVDPDKENQLVLGPYAGEPTEHTRIGFGEGICGQAADKKTTIIVDDVSSESNYLSCNINVKSEIVLPIFKNDNIVGELDLDSHELNRFSKRDEEFLSRVIDIIIPVF